MIYLVYVDILIPHRFNGVGLKKRSKKFICRKKKEEKHNNINYCHDGHDGNNKQYQMQQCVIIPQIELISMETMQWRFTQIGIHGLAMNRIKKCYETETKTKK